MNRSKFGTSKLVSLLAWLSLISAFLIGHFAAKPNYVQLLSKHFPDSTFFHCAKQRKWPSGFSAPP